MKAQLYDLAHPVRVVPEAVGQGAGLPCCHPRKDSDQVRRGAVPEDPEQHGWNLDGVRVHNVWIGLQEGSQVTFIFLRQMRHNRLMEWDTRVQVVRSYCHITSSIRSDDAGDSRPRAT